MLEKKDYTVGTYIKKKPRKEKIGSICPTCAKCKDRKLCKNRHSTKLMLKCPECKECADKDACDTFYISEEHKVLLNVGKDKETGKTIRKGFNGKTEAEAIYKAIEYQKSVANGEIIPETNKKNPSVLSIAQEYEKNKLKNGIITECTYHTNTFSISHIKNENWANIPINEVTRKSIENFLLSERLNGMSNSMLKKVYRIVKVAFDIALDRGYINNSQHHFLGRYGIIRPRSLKKDKKVRALTLDEQTKLMNYLKYNTTTHSDLLLLSVNTGARIGELLGLTIEDVHLEEDYFEINRTTTMNIEGHTILGTTTKTMAGERTVILNEITKPILEHAIKNRHLNGNGLIFCKPDGSLYSDGTINSAFKRICEKAGIKDSVNTHMLRHTFITRAKEAGVNVQATKSTVGHQRTYLTEDIYNENQQDFLKQQGELYVNYMRELNCT